MSSTRQLAAIMFTDIVGYTALMGKNAAKALDLIRISKEVQKPLVEKHHGQWLKEMGDGALAKFGTALDAVNCAVEIQELARAKFDGKLRIGIHSGDVTVQNNDVYGDGVNVAARLESIADPGGIYISDAIEKAIQGQTSIQAKYLGEIRLKNVAYSVRTYAVQGVGLPMPEIKDKSGLSGHFWAELQRRGVVRAATAYLVVGLLMVLLLNQIKDWGVLLPQWSFTALPILLGIGLPLALYLAWKYERGPEGFVKTTSPESWQNPLKASQRKPLTGNLIISILVLIVIGLIAYPRFRALDENLTFPVNKSIAVLPMEIIGEDTEGAYFAEGVREEILNHLSLIKDLNVKSRSVVDRLQGSATTTQELAAQLGLTHYLEGSANKVGDQIRVTVQLIDAFTNDHIWAESYDHSYDNLLSTQSEIAKKVAAALQIRISPEVSRIIDKKPTDNPQAWDNYLQAAHHWRKYAALRKRADLENMVRFLKAAIKLDPDFALAYSRLAMAYQQVPFDPDIVFDFINVDSVLILCDKAIELDNTLGDPYLRRAEYHARIAQDSSAAIQDYKTAISIDPQAPESYLRYAVFHHDKYWDLASALKLVSQGLQKQPDSWLLADMLAEIGWYYMEVGLYQKAENYLHKALIYAPDNLPIHSMQVQLYRVSGQFDKEFATIQRMMEISPLNIGLLELGIHFAIVGDYTQAVKHFEEFFTKASETAHISTMHQNHNYAYCLLKLGRLPEANARFKISIDDLRKNNLTPHYEYAKIFAAKGVLDSAYYHLGNAVAGPIHWGMADHMDDDRLFENIKDEPEFQRLAGIAHEKVRKKRVEVLELEDAGLIPRNVDELELY